MFLHTNIIIGLMARTSAKLNIRILSIKKREDWVHIMENHLLLEDSYLLSIEKRKYMIGIVKLGMKTIRNIHMRYLSKSESHLQVLKSTHVGDKVGDKNITNMQWNVGDIKLMLVIFLSPIVIIPEGRKVILSFDGDK